MARNLSTPDWQTRIRTGRSLVPDLPLDKIAAQRGTRHTNSGYRFADSRHATVTERASGWRIISTCRSCPQAAHTPGLSLSPTSWGRFFVRLLSRCNWDLGPARQLFWIESERLKLRAPFSRRITEPLDTDAAGQATFDCCFDQVGREEGERDGHIHLSNAAFLASAKLCDRGYTT